MPKCEFYRTETVTMRAHAAHSNKREPAPQRVVAGFCVHEFSPVSRAKAVTEMGGAKLLGCGGDLGKCPIADKL